MSVVCLRTERQGHGGGEKQMDMYAMCGWANHGTQIKSKNYDSKGNLSVSTLSSQTMT